jgi:rod shape-determining protein MreD
MIPIKQDQGNGNGIIIGSFMLAIILTAWPLPDWLTNWRPAWVPIFLIYWCMAIPDRVGIAVAWFLGLLLDVIHSNILGQNALGMVLIAYITLNSYHRMRVFPLAQQAFVVFAYLLLYELIMYVISIYTVNRLLDWTYWMPAVTSMFLWPWVFVLLRDLRRKYNIT